MTAEIAVLNKSAVALAADSKVTIGDRAALKTYDTVNKVFTLSKVHPVGIMIFGNAEFMDYPWETIIKLYRKQKKRVEEETIEAWAEDFAAYVSSFGKISRKEVASNIYRILTSVFSEITVRAEQTANEFDIPILSDEYNNILHEYMGLFIEAAVNCPLLLSEDEFNSIIKQYIKSISSSIGDYFGPNDGETRQLAIKLASAVLAQDYYSPNHSGFVVAGFGKSEIFPSMTEYKTDGYVDLNKLRIRREKTTSIGAKIRSCIKPFAQRDMAGRFMDGIDPDFQNFLNGVFVSSLEESTLSVLEKYGSAENQTDEKRQEIRDAAQKQAREIANRARTYGKKRFSSPIMRMVALLPKDELAHLAESLVALTSLKRRVSSDIETVGGPIDVAVISKGDGFIWIKRKHYFKAELNPQFALQYLADIEGTPAPRRRRTRRVTNVESTTGGTVGVPVGTGGREGEEPGAGSGPAAPA